MLLSGILAWACLASADAPAVPKPSIVFILADDLGYGDVRALNPRSRIPTPHLDRLAAEGMVFLDAHSPSSVCTPTRYGVLTGRYAWRTRLERGVLNGFSPPLIDPKTDPGRTTVASFLRSQGYHTAAIGKWHLGLGWARRAGGDRAAIDFSRPITAGPTTLGFETFFGIPASLDMPPYVYVRDDRVVEPPNAEQRARPFPEFIRAGARAPGFEPAQVLDRLADEAVRTIEARAKLPTPFFLYFPLTAPHKPVEPAARYRGKTALGPYGDFVHQVDATLGRVLEALDRTGARDRTLVLFTSDNGSFMYRRDAADARDHVDDASIQAFRSDRHTASGPYRGTKADIWEAGHRVPFIARWPGTVPAGSRCDQTICLTDLLATCAAIVGQELPTGAGEDSWSLLDLLRGQTPRRPRPLVVHHSANGMFAIRDGRHKLVLGNGSGGREKPRGRPFGGPYGLFDLFLDPAETRNRIEELPEVADRLTKAFERIRGSRPSAAVPAGRP